MGAVVTDEPRLVENDVHVCVAKARARDKSLTYSEALAYYESLGQLKSSDIRGCNFHKRNRGCIAAIPFCGLRENVKILYVGQHNSFTKRRRNPTLSVLPIDKRYKENEGENLLND